MKAIGDKDSLFALGLYEFLFNGALLCDWSPRSLCIILQSAGQHSREGRIIEVAQLCGKKNEICRHSEKDLSSSQLLSF